MSQSLPTPFTPDGEFTSLETSRRGRGSLSITALARFEFEAGKGNDGTKILMIEWEDDDWSRSSFPPCGSWNVEWEGKKAVLPADERAGSNTRRLYFLLPPHVTIPPAVTLSYNPPTSSATSSEKPNPIQLNPLPAIFPPELGADGRSAGKRGVLHTIWAKKRLQVLEKEIHEESQSNVEGIALHMALQEKEWIETNFGLGPDAHRHSVQAQDPSYPMGPATPVSPSTGGKLGDKLRGLKLQTGHRELSANAEASHLLSPQSPDVAVSSFNSFHSVQPSVQQSQPTSHPTSQPPKAVAHYPPESIQAQQNVGFSTGFASMGGATAHSTSSDSGEDLFAKALSPRSPDLPRSPFSFSPESLHM
ncbi:hypothetical protein BDW59DRAFT_127605 [Aspergillus cavernicola]|uniref:Uncharacterized protein n=1 Tax=Aspergillus cavernicola TaxID=176166 RepID=A0ABR4HUY6_9EURO